MLSIIGWADGGEERNEALGHGQAGGCSRPSDQKGIEHALDLA
jgi:hypothetical protein